MTPQRDRAAPPIIGADVGLPLARAAVSSCAGPAPPPGFRSPDGVGSALFLSAPAPEYVSAHEIGGPA